MSLRTYTGRAPSRGPGTASVVIVWALAAITIALQIAYPLTVDSSQTRVTLAVSIVVTFALASFVHAWVYRGPLWAGGFFAIAIVGAFVAELIGTRTGWPFGRYVYSDVLGVTVNGVPALVALAWAMMLYPTYVVATTLTRSQLWGAVIGGYSMMCWDFFLDPMMVHLGAWKWESNTAAQLPGIAGIPLQNFVGWFFVATVLLLILLMLLPNDVAVPIGQPATLYLWVYASSVLGAAVWFDRGSVALVGGLAMAIVVVPFTYRVWVERA